MTEKIPKPHIFPNPAFRDAPVVEFEKRAAELEPRIVDALRSLGNEAIEAYSSVRLYHNTLGDLVPTIMQEGLHPGSPVATPDSIDVQFAEDLFLAKGDPRASRSMFNIYIKGERDDRRPGIFLYGKKPDAIEEYNVGYGQPERLRIFTNEMGYIMAQTEGPYTEAERARAAELFQKYADMVNGGKSGHISVIAANPFSPPVFNERLAGLPEASLNDTETTLFLLKNLGVHVFEGIYIPDTIPPQDLVVMDVELPILGKLDEANIDPSFSRYFYTPQHLRRAY